ncbi:RAS protein activator like-3 isoform X2 [Rhineura floridana]|uniref:RAS protein activator like-3 isoform X2 n=1 Tax=Rhineura floridana TaxID=261503 RepID=UPI002AC7EDAE|nr:RAS protein activator like-3 isoform X2 [Rhineura floridana]
MEAAQKHRSRTDTPSLLRSYRWQIVQQYVEKEPELSPNHASGGGSRRRGKLQKWKRAQSQPESEHPEPGHEQPSPPVAPQDNRAVAKRSVFQRAFSTPAKLPKAQEGSSKLSLRKYLRSMSHRRNQDGTLQSERETKEVSKGDNSALQLTRMTSAVTTDTPLWDVANVSLFDQQIVVLGRDEEGLLQNRKRASSTVSESSSLYPPVCQRDCEMSTEGRNFLDSQTAEKRPFQEGSSGPQLSNVKGLLWRRIRDRKGRVQTKTDSSNGLVANGDREAPLGPALLLDLSNEKDVLIRPLHSSLLGERHCFEVLSAGGRRCFSCASAAERTRWMDDLRRVVQPSMDNCERIERMLSLWVYEARDLVPRKRYLSELRLDGVLYARTTTKQARPTGTIFWGEHFDLKALPPAVELQVCLVQEEEGQRPKGSTIASMAMPLHELAAVRQPLERWYPLGGERPNMPTLRLRGRYCNIRVLPIVQYKEFAEYLTFHYRELCAGLEHSLNARDKEELTGVLVRVLQSTGKAKDFLIDLGVAELDRFDEREALIFRENTLATKAIDEYMKLVGGPYLLATLSDIVAQPCSLENSCEVDPSKCAPCDLADNRSNLEHICEEIFQRIAASSHSFPAELSEVFSAWQEACQLRGKAGIGQRLISASLFLRFLCPAIMSPSLFGLTQEYPDDTTSRTLTLVAKVIQNLANLTTFGEKEAYMSFMNEFLESKWGTMKTFLSSVSSPGSAIHLPAYDDSIDLALELSILHALLCNIFSTLEEWTRERLEPLPTILHAIQEGTPVPVTVRLGPNADERQTESQKPGFVPPRELGKHSPLIKSQSMTSIQKGRAKEEPLAPVQPAKTRSKVQRTQSVPTQSKAARHLEKQSSTQHVAKSQDSSPRLSTSYPHADGSSSSKAFQGCSKLHPSTSLHPKPTVPWLRHSEEAAAKQSGLYAMHPLEQYGRQMEELQMELTTAREKQQLFEEQLERLTIQNQMLLEEQAKFQEREETLCTRLEDTESCLMQLSSRISGVETNWKKDHEKLRASEEKTKHLEHRLSGMERDHDQLLRAVSQMLGFRGKQSSTLQRRLSGPVWVNRAENGDET